VLMGTDGKVMGYRWESDGGADGEVMGTNGEVLGY
jgi:hypothetical protein